MKTYRLSLFHKSLIALLIILFPLFVTFVYSYNRSREHLKKGILNDLTSISEAYEGQVYQFLEMSKRRVRDFSSDGLIKKELQDIEELKRSPVILTEHLIKNKLAIDKTIDRIYVISSDGHVVASTSPKNIGRDVSNELFFKISSIGDGANVTERKSSAGATEIVATAPIFSRTGKFIGVLANFLELSELNKVLNGEFNRELGALSWEKPGRETFEVYIVNKDSRIITEPSKKKAGALFKTINTVPVDACLKSQKEMAGFYRNYDGSEVAGASMCMPKLGWTLVAEVSADEALEPLQNVKKDAILAAVVVAGLIGALFIAFYKIVISRLSRISGASASLATGDYDVRLPVTSSDELGALSETFNRMAGEIKERSALLRESEERLKAIINNSKAVIYLKDAEGRFILANREHNELFKVPGDSIRGLKDSDIFPKEMAEAFRSNDLKVLTAGHSMQFEEAAPLEGGLRYYVSIKAPLFDSSGVPFAVCGISTDITDRKIAEAKVARLNRLYSVLSKINEAIVRIRDTNELYRQACRIAVEDGEFLMAWIGAADPETLQVKSLAGWGVSADCYLNEVFISARDIPEGRGPTGSAIREGRTFVCNDIEHAPAMKPWKDKPLSYGFRSSVSLPLHVSGNIAGAFTLYSAELNFFNDEEIKLLEALTADISFAIESIETERQARLRNEELQFLQDISFSVSEAEDFQSALKVVISKICKMTGWEFGEVWTVRPDRASLEYASAWHGSSESIEEFVRSSMELRPLMGMGLPGRIWATKKPEWVRELSEKDSAFLRGPNAAKAGLFTGLGVPIAAGEEVVAVLVFFMSRTRKEDRRFIDLIPAVAAQLGSVIKRKLSEEARIELKNRYEGLVNNLAVGIYRERERDGCIQEVNNALIDMFEAGCKEKLLLRRLSDFYADRERAAGLKERMLKTGFIRNEVVELVALKGRRFWASLTAVMKKDNEGNIYFDGVIEDITERKKLEEQLLQSQKMEAIGHLAGGIAHDFNNILTAIVGYGNLMILKRGGDEMVKGYSERILTLSDRAASLTQGLLAFSRKQIMNPKPVNLNDLMRRIESILQRLIGEDIELKASLAKKTLTVKVDPTQIEQVLMNLATNARDAMPSGGELIIGMEPVRLDNDFIRAHGYGEAGNFARITFADTGMGMDEETRKKIFEPFFTTKEVGKGTGLGLSTVYGIIKQHNGFINVYSEPGMGTIFKIYLPLTVDAKADEAAAPGKEDIKGGTETVLLAEDEADVRGIIKTILEEFGYKVIEAVNGEEAVEQYVKNKDIIDLLVFDTIMPKKNGKEAYEEINRVTPGVKALFTSGYTPENLRARGDFGAGSNFMTKPVSPGDFLKKVREILDK